jgi:hypothetical protein
MVILKLEHSLRLMGGENTPLTGTGKLSLVIKKKG